MNNTALAIIKRDELDTIQEAAKVLALSDYFDGKGNTPKAIAMIAVKIMAGREMGFGPFASANGIHIISGKPSVGANLMASAVKSSGRYDYRVKEMTNDVCSIEFFEREDGKKVSVGVSSFTKEDAKNAGTQNMTKFARNMLFARAMSNGVRWFCPDIFSGTPVYTPEELGAEVDGEGNVIDVTPRKVDGSTGEIVDVTRDSQPEPSATPPHQRMFNEGFRVFGDAWNNGARKWFLRFWSKHATPSDLRESAADFSDTEKDLIADYLVENRAKLQKVWGEYEATKQLDAVAA